MCGLKVFDYFDGDDVWILSAFQRFSFLETDFVFEPRKA